MSDLAARLRFRSSAVRELLGLENAQIDYWTRAGIIQPAVRGRSTVERAYDYRNLVEFVFAQALDNAGVPVKDIARLFGDLNDRESGRSQLSGFDQFLTTPNLADVQYLAVALNASNRPAKYSRYRMAAFLSAPTLEAWQRQHDVVVVVNAARIVTVLNAAVRELIRRELAEHRRKAGVDKRRRRLDPAVGVTDEDMARLVDELAEHRGVVARGARQGGTEP